MRVYLRVVLPLSLALNSYGVLAFFWGERGVCAMRLLEREKKELVHHIQTLAERGRDLAAVVDALSFDEETIGAYARQLGYVRAGDVLVRPVNFTVAHMHTLDSGDARPLVAPACFSDTRCKVYALCVGFFVVLLQLLWGSARAYFKT
ncbi:probable septum formation initiator [Treponema paraluiscuniculi Cuniculi A]|uniref:Septum formation initiator n=2 Tax=Treponema paraluiscuniculi TaxID=53435 RepID=A0ABY9E319_9SPIR|nr:septum formation initiator family protein [Treponema paraluiscuniculi]AEH40131.1 probable septum formation initiator [Treponema paraluiscuniculi Cuniculi A]WKC72065.1 putative septum formation initiator [Treponema paraluiscuniculi]